MSSIDDASATASQFALSAPSAPQTATAEATASTTKKSALARSLDAKSELQRRATAIELASFAALPWSADCSQKACVSRIRTSLLGGLIWVATVVVACGAIIAAFYPGTLDIALYNYNKIADLIRSDILLQIRNQISLIENSVASLSASIAANPTSAFAVQNAYTIVQKSQETDFKALPGFFLASSNNTVYGVEGFFSTGMYNFEITGSTSRNIALRPIATDPTELTFNATLPATTKPLPSSSYPTCFNGSMQTTGLWTNPVPWYERAQYFYCASVGTIDALNNTNNQQNTRAVLSASMPLFLFDGIIDQILEIYKIHGMFVALIGHNGEYLSGNIGIDTLACDSFCDNTLIKMFTQSTNNTITYYIVDAFSLSKQRFPNVNQGRQLFRINTSTYYTDLYSLDVGPRFPSLFLITMTPKNTIFFAVMMQLLLGIAIASGFVFLVITTSHPTMNLVSRPIISLYSVIVDYFRRYNPESKSVNMFTMILHGSASAAALARNNAPGQSKPSGVGSRAIFTDTKKFETSMHILFKAVQKAEKFVPECAVERVVSFDRSAVSLQLVPQEAVILWISFERFSEKIELLSKDRVATLFGILANTIFKIVGKHKVTWKYGSGCSYMFAFRDTHPLGLQVRVAMRFLSDLRRAILGLSSSLKRQGLPSQSLVATVHVGECYIGNFGAKGLLCHGMTGDACDICNSLNTVHAVFGVRFLISDQAQKYISQESKAFTIKRKSLRSQADHDVHPTMISMAMIYTRPLAEIIARSRTIKGTVKNRLLVHELMICPRSEDQELLRDYKVLFSEFYSDATNWSDSEVRANFNETLARYTKNYPNDVAAKVLTGLAVENKYGAPVNIPPA